MAIVINGTGTISGISATDGLSSPQTGSVLQVVNATLTATTSTSSTTFVDTGLTATITPKFSTSKILVLLQSSASGNSNGVGVAINKNGTVIWTSPYDSGPKYYSAYFGISWTCPISVNYLDSPATTSALTYKIQYNAYSASTVQYNLAGGTATLQLLEIAG